VPAHPGSRSAHVWAEVVGGDALSRGHEPALCWWLPEGSSVQHAYRLRTDDGFDTGRVDSQTQSYVRMPVFDQSRRSAKAQVKVWTDLGESEWSDPVALEAGLLEDRDWTARWIGADEDPRPGKGSRPACWLRTTVDVPAFGEARLYITALGLYEAFLDGRRVGEPKAQMVRCDHVVAVGERRNQISEHVGTGRKSVQQDQGGRTCVAGFTEEQPMTVDGGKTMMNSRHEIPPEPCSSWPRPTWAGLRRCFGNPPRYSSGLFNPLCTKTSGWQEASQRLTRPPPMHIMGQLSHFANTG